MTRPRPSAQLAPQLSIGSTVRVASQVCIGDNSGDKHEFESIARRAIVVTIPKSNDKDAATSTSQSTDSSNAKSKTISLVQDDLAPRPLRVPGRGVSNFLFAPMFHSRGIQVEKFESLVGDVMELLPFERKDLVMEMAESDATLTTTALVQKYKDYGDQLLKLHDFTSAVSYYEAALGLISSKCDVVAGESCVVRKDGNLMVAEVDRLDLDGSLLDCQQGEQKEIIMAIWSNNYNHNSISNCDEKPSQILQIEILLNICWCLLRLADIDHTKGNGGCFGDTILSSSSSSKKKKHSDRREKYRLAAVLGSSVAITLCDYYTLVSGDDSIEGGFLLTTLKEKARTVRCRSFIGLQDFHNAMLDTKKILDSREAQELHQKIKVLEKHKEDMDKKNPRKK